jgi:hypothetical protein
LLAQGLAQEGRKPAISEPSASKVSDPDLARLLELWERLPEAGRKLLRQTAETICGELNPQR